MAGPYLEVDSWPGPDAYFVSLRREITGVALAGLRRLVAIQRIYPEDAFHLEPLNVRLDADGMSTTIYAYAGRLLLDREPSLAPPVSPRRLLSDVGYGYTRYQDVIDERFPDWRTRGSDASLPAILTASDGSLRFGSGGAGAAILVPMPVAERCIAFLLELNRARERPVRSVLKRWGSCCRWSQLITGPVAPRRRLSYIR